MTKTTHPSRDRTELVARSFREARRWRDRVDALTVLLRGDARASGAQLQALRDKCDTFANKVEALRHHEQRAWIRARTELELARGELQVAWRSALRALDRGAVADALD